MKTVSYSLIVLVCILNKLKPLHLYAEVQNGTPLQASSPESEVEDSLKRLKIRLPKFKKRDTSRNADPDYAETVQRPRPKKRRRRFDEIITEDDEIVKVEREEKLTPYEGSL